MMGTFRLRAMIFPSSIAALTVLGGTLRASQAARSVLATSGSRRVMSISCFSSPVCHRCSLALPRPTVIENIRDVAPSADPCLILRSQPLSSNFGRLHCAPSKSRIRINSVPSVHQDSNTNKVKRAALSTVRISREVVTFPIRLLSVIRKKLLPENDGNKVSSAEDQITVKESLFYLVTYLTVGMICYHSLFDHWSIVDALYFSVATFTTVGYGDVTPRSKMGRLFTCFFGMGGVIFLATTLSASGSSLIQVEIDAIEAARKAATNRTMGIFEGMPHILDRIRKGEKDYVVGANADNKILDGTKNKKPASGWQKLAFKYFPILVELMLGGIIIGSLEGWKWYESIYYSIITAGTIGYGDLAPKTRTARMFAIVFIPFAVGVAGQIIGNIASSQLEKRRARYYQNLVSKELNLDDLRKMDMNKSGEVSRREYVEFMLTQMGLADQDLIDDLHAQFDRLDVTNNGSLAKDDLKLMAELRSKGLKIIS